MQDRERLSTDEFARWWKETGETELRQLLYWTWDPIGVNESFPYTADEYNQYAPQIVEALRMDPTEDQIVDMLKMVERERMGIGCDPAGLLSSVAARIILWYELSQERWTDGTVH
jgi:hypothetical protein